MYRNRRSFTRELLSLIPNIENEFSGQIKIIPFDETDMLSIMFEITPSKGLYAHAAFIFRVDATLSYPFQPPKLSCLTNIFHPNITNDNNNNICLNMMENWLPHYGLKDILSAILFLLYEPNFEDPMNYNASKPEEGLSMELTILRSLMGGTVNDIYYAPNEVWCRWAEENNISVKLPSRSQKNIPEKPGELSIQSPMHQNSTLSGFFRQAISGQFTPIAHSTYDNWPHHINVEQGITFAFSRYITVKPTSNFTCDIEEAVQNARRYYYTEVGGYGQWQRIHGLIAKSAYGLTTDVNGLDWQSEHSSVIGLWPSPMEHIDSVVSEDFITHEQYLQHETNSDGDHTETPNFPGSEHDSLQDENEEQMDSEMDTQKKFNTEATNSMAPDISQQQYCNVGEEATEPLSTNNTVLPCAIEEDSHEGVFAVLPETSNCLSPSVPAEHEHEEQQQQQTADDDFESNNWGNFTDNDGESDQCSTFDESEYPSPDGLNYYFTEQQDKTANLDPWFWILYQTRWPPYLAPNRSTEIVRGKRKSKTHRASSAVLRSDLFRVGNRCDGQRLFILVDSLSISPFSPIINRAVCLQTRKRNAVTWYSLDWASVWDVFKSTITGRSSFTQSKHFRLPAVLFGLCYVHNWVAYLSRIELYGLCLGYSRPWKNTMLNYTAASCLIPATLGCGQCGLLGVWPMWLAWRSTRWLCHLLALWTARDITHKQNLHVSHPKIYFPFSDLDEI